MSHKVIIADSARAAVQNPSLRQELTGDQCSILDQCLSQPEPSDQDMHRVLRILGRVYACGD